MIWEFTLDDISIESTEIEGQKANTCRLMARFNGISGPNRKLKSSIKPKNTKAPFSIVADMFAQKRLCRITVKVIKNHTWMLDCLDLPNSNIKKRLSML